MNYIETELLRIFEGVGIYLTEDDYDDKIPMDSLQFVNILVQIEDTFSVTIEDEYYYSDNLSTFNSMYNLISKYLEEKKCEATV